MARRGDKLHEHILWAAKDVFLDMGFERASMDAVAARAQTSKRSLYAHFESKEKLFLAIIALVRGLFLARLGVPGDYSARPAEALALFCGRYLEILLHRGSIQMLRVSMAESERFPEQAAQYFDVLLAEVQARLAAYLKAEFKLTPRASAEAAQGLLGQLLYPRLLRALFGQDPLAKSFNPDGLPADFDLKPVRKAVADALAALPKRQPPAAE